MNELSQLIEQQPETIALLQIHAMIYNHYYHISQPSHPTAFKSIKAIQGILEHHKVPYLVGNLGRLGLHRYQQFIFCR